MQTMDFTDLPVLWISQNVIISQILFYEHIHFQHVKTKYIIKPATTLKLYLCLTYNKH